MTFFSRNILNLRVLACFIPLHISPNPILPRGHNDLDVSKKYESSWGGGTLVCSHTGACGLFDQKYFRQGANLGFN